MRIAFCTSAASHSQLSHCLTSRVRLCSPSVSMLTRPVLLIMYITSFAMIIYPFTGIDISMVSTRALIWALEDIQHCLNPVPSYRICQPHFLSCTSLSVNFWLHRTIEPSALQKDQILVDQRRNSCMITFSRTTLQGVGSTEARI